MNIEQFNYDTDLLQVILWQYNEATNLLGLLNQKQAWYDVNQSQFWSDWYNQIFNLSAPNDRISTFGLSVWSIILDVPLFVPQGEIVPGVVWGFNAFDPVIQTGTLNGTTTVTGLTDAETALFAGMEVSDGNVYITPGTFIFSITDNSTIVLSATAIGSATESLTFTGPPLYVNDNLNFTNAPFPPGAPLIYLTPPQQQFILLLKYFNCTNRGTISTPQSPIYTQDESSTMIYSHNFIYNINWYLNYLCFQMGDRIGYSGQTIFCHDNLDMTISYVFSDPSAFPSALLSAINLLDLFPRPAGVSIV